MVTHRDTLERLARQVQATDFGQPFRIYPLGSFTSDDVGDVHAPEVVNDPTGDVDVLSSEWEALTGMTGQYAYNGACMHPSEFVGRSIAGRLLDLAYEENEPQTFVLVVVESDDYDDDPVGWAILHHTS